MARHNNAEGTDSWNVPPPDRSSRQIHVMAPIPGAPIRGMIVSRAIVGVQLHWLCTPTMKGGGRSVPHSEPASHCPLCRSLNQRPRWHGYVGVWLPGVERHAIFALSIHAVQSCPRLSASCPFSLRGLDILLRRIGKSANSPVIAELSEESRAEHTIPAEFDVRASLSRLWGVAPPEAVQAASKQEQRQPPR